MMEVLGYQLIKLDSTHYDASVLAKYEKIEDIYRKVQKLTNELKVIKA